MSVKRNSEILLVASDSVSGIDCIGCFTHQIDKQYAWHAAGCANLNKHKICTEIENFCGFFKVWNYINLIIWANNWENHNGKKDKIIHKS